jgi:glycosyltransferase involved in cell wall biosynthesis
MISVIIPTYKEPEALDLCLQSIIEGQQNKNQIIVVVDGHYDINKNVLEKYVGLVDILNLEQNVGLCRATNLGVFNAMYDKILIINDDNVAPKDWDVKLEIINVKGKVVSPNQIEPYPSMFRQFNIKDLGCEPKTFDLNKFWEYESKVSTDVIEQNGSTLPIFMLKLDYLRVGGWDENYELGLVADWDFFLKCQLSGLQMVRTYNCHFYHFGSLTVNNTKRKDAETNCHGYAKYKWGKYIQHNSETNLKYL